jgi:anti-anti-sigma factor
VPTESRSKLSCRVRQLDGTALITATGGIDAHTVAQLERCLVQPGVTHGVVIFDLSAITFFGVSGIEALVRARAAYRRRGVHVTMTPAPVVARVMRAAGVHDMFAPDHRR